MTTNIILFPFLVRENNTIRFEMSTIIFHLRQLRLRAVDDGKSAKCNVSWVGWSTWPMFGVVVWPLQNDVNVGARAGVA